MSSVCMICAHPIDGPWVRTSSGFMCLDKDVCQQRRGLTEGPSRATNARPSDDARGERRAGPSVSSLDNNGDAI